MAVGSSSLGSGTTSGGRDATKQYVNSTTVVLPAASANV